ncbi:MAG: hypothetical protein F6K54_06155 [Okeania sp. SIO3B5]|uniref:hypothetical protein n=1 Tax=Okeania sp. SIO3B5 TaxID=2607811 RepID=UPI0014004CCF|nr:hypothetical protein [Okeania sp. SIO3B5]NEO52696.1 hypothetical protein [Okeania sp. SIO3B5]
MSKTPQSSANIQKTRLELNSSAQSLDYHRKFLQQVETKLKNLSCSSIKESQEVEISIQKKLVHCILLTFYFNEVLERCLEGLLPEKDRIDVSVIENSSVYSNTIQKVVDLYREKGLVKNHFIFDKNIGTNAFEIAFDSNLLDLDYEYIIVTDGDLVPDKGWLDEQIVILEKCPEVFSVSGELHLGNASVPLRHKILQIQNNVKFKNDLYKERNAGWVVKTFRASDWKDFLNFRKKNNVYFHDCSVHYYANINRNMRSATTLKSKCYHLTWDYVDNKYDELKKSLMAETNNPWYHNRYSAFRFINDCKQELLFPQPPEVPHQYADSIK